MTNKNLKIPVIDGEGKISGEESLEILASMATVSPRLTAQAVRVFLSNQRKAKAKTKTRAEVKGSKSKIWRQKGTGRARHGDRQAPIFVGGGVAHGPTGTQNYKLRLSKKMLRKAILAILIDKINQKKLYLLKKAGFKKTKDAYLCLKRAKESLQVSGRISFLVVKEDELKRWLRNLSGVQIINADSLNPYCLLRNDFLLLSQPALKKVEDYLGARKEKNADRA